MQEEIKRLKARHKELSKTPEQPKPEIIKAHYHMQHLKSTIASIRANRYTSASPSNYWAITEPVPESSTVQGKAPQATLV